MTDWQENRLRYVRAKTESPIEKMLADALAEETRFKLVSKFEIPVALQWGAIYLCLQYRVLGYRLDMAVLFVDRHGVSHKWAIECDGKKWHSSPSQKARDAKRDAKLTANGWAVRRYTGGKIYHECAPLADRISDEVTAVQSGVEYAGLDQYLNIQQAA